MHTKQIQSFSLKSEREKQFSVSDATLFLAYCVSWSPQECTKQPFKCELYLPKQSEAVRSGVESGSCPSVGESLGLRSFKLGRRSPGIWPSPLSAPPTSNPAPSDFLIPHSHSQILPCILSLQDRAGIWPPGVLLCLGWDWGRGWWEKQSLGSVRRAELALGQAVLFDLSPEY